MASGTINKTMIKSYHNETAAQNISSGNNYEFSLTIPNSATEILAVIPLAIKVGTTYGSAVPAMVVDVVISGVTATVKVRSFSTQTYRVQYTLLYR